MLMFYEIEVWLTLYVNIIRITRKRFKSFEIMKVKEQAIMELNQCLKLEDDNLLEFVKICLWHHVVQISNLFYELEKKMYSVTTW